MKLGIISDIHGDIEGLRRALDLFATLSVDTILCAGDLVDRGSDSVGVVKLIEVRQIATVMGNHDRSAPQVERMIRKNPELRSLYSTHGLPDDVLAYLEQLPRLLRFEYEGVRLLMAHGSPWDLETYVTPMALSKVFRRVVEEADADIVILGHTHQPMQVLAGQTLVLNAGSVYDVRTLHAAFRRSCALLTLPEKTFTLYDIDTRQAMALPLIKHPL